MFALNCSVSKATKAVPYSVVFGRTPVLPVDVRLGSTPARNRDVVSPRDYSEEVHVSLKQLWDNVREALHLSKDAMVERYNRNLRFYDYQPGDRVWLKTDVINVSDHQFLSKMIYSLLGPKLKQIHIDCP